MAAPSTFAALLDARLRSEPGAPLVTYYDDATGERTELSATSYANWVAKHANLWVEELDLEPDDGATVLVDLPPHWLVPVVVGGAWLAGVAVTTDREVPHDVVVTDAGSAASHATGAAGPTVLACSLHPFALPGTGSLPDGVLDHGHLWPGQSDAFVAVAPADAATTAWRSTGGDLSQSDLLARALEAAPAPGSRVLTAGHPADDHGVPGFLAPLLTGSVVYVRHADAAAWDDRLRQERVDQVLGPAPGQPPVA